MQQRVAWLQETKACVHLLYTPVQHACTHTRAHTHTRTHTLHATTRAGAGAGASTGSVHSRHRHWHRHRHCGGGQQVSTQQGPWQGHHQSSQACGGMHRNVVPAWAWSHGSPTEWAVVESVRTGRAADLMAARMEPCLDLRIHHDHRTCTYTTTTYITTNASTLHT